MLRMIIETYVNFYELLALVIIYNVLFTTKFSSYKLLNLSRMYLEKSDGGESTNINVNRHRL